MAVEKTGSVNTYTPGGYQSSTDYSSSMKDMVNKVEKPDIIDVEPQMSKQNDTQKRPDPMDRITLDSIKDKDAEPSTDDKIQDVIEDQKFVHDKIRKSLDDYSSRMGNYEAKFGMHEATNRVMIKLVDKDTKEVIKELPPEKTLDMIAKCLEQAGILVDEKV